MSPRELSRLNSLFEKMVADSANIKEQRELTQLYQEFINDGRDFSRTLRCIHSVDQVG